MLWLATNRQLHRSLWPRCEGLCGWWRWSPPKWPKNREVLLPSGAGQAVAAAQIQVDTEDRPLDRKFLRMGVFGRCKPYWVLELQNASKKNIEKKGFVKKNAESAESSHQRSFWQSQTNFRAPKKQTINFPHSMQELPFCAMDVATPPVTGSLTADGQLDLDAGCHYRLSLGHNFDVNGTCFSCLMFEILLVSVTLWARTRVEQKNRFPLFGCQRCIGWLEVRYQNLSYRGVKTKMPPNASKDSKTK